MQLLEQPKAKSADMQSTADQHFSCFASSKVINYVLKVNTTQDITFNTHQGQPVQLLLAQG